MTRTKAQFAVPTGESACVACSFRRNLSLSRRAAMALPTGRPLATLKVSRVRPQA